MNEFLFLIATVCCLGLVVLMYRLFGKIGLYAWSAIAAVLVNLITPKCITLFGLATSAGNILYASTFLVTDILSENHTHQEARKCVLIGGIGTLCYLAVSQVTLLFTPNEYDFISNSMRDVFSLAPRLTIASVACYFVSNMLDTYLYKWLSKRTSKIWIKNNVATMTSQFLDSVLFTLFAFAGIMPTRGLIEFAITLCLLKFFVAILDTPFAYLGKIIYTNFHRNKQ